MEDNVVGVGRSTYDVIQVRAQFLEKLRATVLICLFFFFKVKDRSRHNSKFTYSFTYSKTSLMYLKRLVNDWSWENPSPSSRNLHSFPVP